MEVENNIPVTNDKIDRTNPKITLKRKVSLNLFFLVLSAIVIN